jgi:ubiquinone/menaquinone biosynthesis C-methylase UbiE
VVAEKRAVDYFDRHAAEYDRKHYRTSRRTFMNARHEELLKLVDTSGVQPGERALDAGCGPGRLTIELARRRYRVHALDAASGMLTIARSNLMDAPHDAISFHQASIDALPFRNESFDLICSAGVIEYLPRYDLVVREFWRALKPGGIMLLPTTNLLAPAHWYRPILQPLLRLPGLAKRFGVNPRAFRVRHHYIPKFRRRLNEVGFEIERERYFYAALPRPLDRLFPGWSVGVERWADRGPEVRRRILAEGYLALARKQGRSSSGF